MAGDFSGGGLVLPVDAARGRPHRFHDARCRQRTRRARLATNNTEPLTALTEVKAAVSQVRRTVLAGEQPPADAGAYCGRRPQNSLSVQDAVTAPTLVRPQPPHRISWNQSRNLPPGNDEPDLETADQPPPPTVRRLDDPDEMAAPRGQVWRGRCRWMETRCADEMVGESGEIRPPVKQRCLSWREASAVRRTAKLA